MKNRVIVVAAGTPPRWGEYLAYIRKYNKDGQDALDRMLIEDQKEWEALPWYLRLVKAQPRHQDIYIFWGEKSPSLLDYYRWDVETSKQEDRG